VNNRGFGIVEVLMGGAMVVITSMLVWTVITDSMSFEKKFTSVFWLQSIRSELIGSLKSKDGFVHTARSNPEMNCIKLKLDQAKLVSCDNGALSEIKVIKGPRGDLLLNNAAPSSGFDSNGRPCSSFEPLAGNDQCPFRYKITWRPVCQSSGCSSPDSIFEGKLEVSFKRKDSIINPKSYSFSLFVAGDGEKELSSCEESLLGDFDKASAKCKLKISMQCPSGQYVKGFNSDGSPICQVVSPINGECSGGLRLSGVDGAGNALCTGWCK
jgi:hypothetical protein